MARVHRYEYTPLSNHDIRLLKVADRNDRICGTIINKSLEDIESSSPSVPYYAISYTWGDQTPSDKIWLSETEYLPLTATAASVLTHVTCDDYIWIDSVCIDQNNPVEKASQLGLMWDIYKGATCVLAWPGGCEDGGDVAMELLFDYAYDAITKDLTGRKSVQLSWPSTEETLDGDEFALPWMLADSDSGGDDDDDDDGSALPSTFSLHRERWAALSKFMDRPWFRRAWVTQELVAAREVSLVMGGWVAMRSDVRARWKYLNSRTNGLCLDWKNVVGIIDELRRGGYLSMLEIVDETKPCSQPILPCAVEVISRVANLKPARDDKRPTFQDNVLNTMGSEASEPRDKIFVVASMSATSHDDDLTLDYTSSVQEIYINATRRLMLRDPCLLTLHMAGIGWKNRMPGLPSWVPDYSVSRRSGTRHGEDMVLGKIAAKAMFASANLGLSQPPTSTRNVGSLSQLFRLYGVIIDDIEVVCPGLAAERSIIRSLQSDNWIDRKVVRSWLEKIHTQICPHGGFKPYITAHIYPQTGEYGSASGPPEDLRALASALIACTDDKGGPLRNFRTRGSHDECTDLYKMFVVEVGRSAARPLSSTQRNVKEGSEQRGAIAYARSLDRFANWTVFRTKYGYIGRGPPLVRKGDKVCVFEGGRTPFVLREARIPWYKPATLYHLVGECYVEGLMAMEACNFISWLCWGHIDLC
jgi:hypothetical protein